MSAKVSNGLHQLRVDANKQFKVDSFSISGLVKYVQAGQNKYLNDLLSKTGFKPEQITVKTVLGHIDPKLLKLKDGSDRKLFSLWAVSGAILRWHAEISAKAALHSPAVKVDKPATEGEQAQKEAAKDEAATGAKLAANKKRNEAAKLAAKIDKPAVIPAKVKRSRVQNKAA